MPKSTGLEVAETLAYTSAILGLLNNVLLPRLAELRKSGDVSLEEQAKLKAEIESLKGRLNGEFSGPAWEPSGT